MFINHYECPSCGNSWQDRWACIVTDDCAGCGERSIEPHESQDSDAMSFHAGLSQFGARRPSAERPIAAFPFFAVALAQAQAARASNPVGG